MKIDIKNYKVLDKGYLKGSFTIVLPDFFDMHLYQVLHFEKDGKAWVSFPEREYQTAQGETKKQWIISPGNGEKPAYEAFQRAVTPLAQQAYKNALGPSAVEHNKIPF